MPRKMRTTEEALVPLINKYGDNYDYSKVNYTGWDKPIIVGCKIHGDFNVLYHNHLQGQGCPECGKISFHNKLSKTTEQFISESKFLYGDKYDYSKTIYVSKRRKVVIGCPKHGDFEVLPQNHLSGRGGGCRKCSYEEKAIKMSIDTDEYIKRAQKIHGDTYDYSRVEYRGSNEKILIGCHKHGYFLQNPSNHLQGGGCPLCLSSKGELKIRRYLEDNNIKFNAQKKFNNCKDKIPLPFDFYLPDYNLCIEYQGEQHYKSVSIFDGEDGLLGRQRRYSIKRDWCSKTDNPDLLEIKYNEDIIEKLKSALHTP